MSQSPGEGEPLAEGTLVSHLLELRDRLLHSVIAVVICFVPLAFFQNELFTLVARPLIDKLPAGTSLIATSVVSPFMAPLKLSLIGAMFIAMPYILFQIWGFVAPGLYKRERRFALPLIVSSIVLFYAGIAFAYYVVFPLMFQFLASTTPMGVKMMTDIANYLDFVLLLFLAFGIAFEMPVAVVLLVASGTGQARGADPQSRLRHPRHLHHRRVPDAAGRRVAELHGRADVPAVRTRHRVRAHDPEEPGHRRRPPPKAEPPSAGGTSTRAVDALLHGDVGALHVLRHARPARAVPGRRGRQAAATASTTRPRRRSTVSTRPRSSWPRCRAAGSPTG